MGQKLITMARELEKLRAEIANAEKRASIVAAANNPGVYSSGIYLSTNKRGLENRNNIQLNQQT